MGKPELSPGAAAACGRLDGFARLAGKDLGRWMIEVARRLAAKGRCRRTLEPAARRARRRSARR